MLASIKKKRSRKTLSILFNTLLFLSFFPSCSSIKKNPKISISLIGEQVFEKGKRFKGLRVGGLSELFFDKASGSLLALSDDKKNHRFYKLSLSKQKPYKLKIVEQVFLKSLGQDGLKINMDPEALVLYKDHFFITSEGQQIYKIHEPTQIFTFNKQAVLKEAWPVPSVFWNKKASKQDALFGQKENKGFESLTIDKQSRKLWTATEEALKQDPKTIVRLNAFSIKNKKMLTQYAYPLKNKETGLVALQFLKSKMFISLERSYKKQKNKGVNTIYLFLTDCRQAHNILSKKTLKLISKACSKTQLWDSSKNSSLKVDNLEGLALGPMLSSQKQLMILVSDNNFNEEKQKTQFLFFELHLPSFRK